MSNTLSHKSAKGAVHMISLLLAIPLLLAQISPSHGFSPVNNILTRRSVLPSKEARKPDVDDDAGELDVLGPPVICGGGPAGLLTAIMLSQKLGPQQKIKVFDRLKAPPSPKDDAVWSDVARFYLLGLGFRGQRALQKFGVWEDVKACCNAAVGRKDWAPDASPEDGVERIFTDRPATTEVIARDKLVGVLHDHIINNYSAQIELNYGYEVKAVDFGRDEESPVLVRVTKCTQVGDPTTSQDKPPEVLCDVANARTIATMLLIAADGTARTIASQMESEDKTKWHDMNSIEKRHYGKPFKVTRYEDDNQRVYKSIPMKLPADWRHDLNYSARSKDGRVIFDALPADSKGTYCGILLLKKDDEFATAITDPKRLRELLIDEYLPQFSPLLDDKDIATIAKKPPSFLPSFRFAGPRLNQGHRTLILGDCAHTVKPYFGLGANSALEDVQVLGECVDSTSSITDAVHLFSSNRSGEAEVLVKLSRELDRPGVLGLLSFIVPLILDSIFHGIAPNLFAPNVLAMFQLDGVDFRGIRRRKRIDRISQTIVLGFLVYGLAQIKPLLLALSRATGQDFTTIVAGIAGLVVFAVILRKASFLLLPDLAPADVLGKMKGKVTNSDSFVTPLGFDDKGDGKE